jgi:hypothetical protein
MTELGRAKLVSAIVVVGLGALALWPRPTWTPPARPPLKAPIVFDELVSHAPPPSDPAAAASAAR